MQPKRGSRRFISTMAAMSSGDGPFRPGLRRCDEDEKSRGYFAGRAKQFDADQIRGFNELVLDYAMPAMMFVATVKTPRWQLLGEGLYALALLVAFVGLFLIVVLVSTRVLRRSLGEAALQA